MNESKIISKEISICNNSLYFLLEKCSSLEIEDLSINIEAGLQDKIDHSIEGICHGLSDLAKKSSIISENSEDIIDYFTIYQKVYKKLGLDDLALEEYIKFIPEDRVNYISKEVDEIFSGKSRLSSDETLNLWNDFFYPQEEVFLNIFGVNPRKKFGKAERKLFLENIKQANISGAMDDAIRPKVTWGRAALAIGFLGPTAIAAAGRGIWKTAKGALENADPSWLSLSEVLVDIALFRRRIIEQIVIKRESDLKNFEKKNKKSLLILEDGQGSTFLDINEISDSTKDMHWEVPTRDFVKVVEPLSKIFSHTQKASRNVHYVEFITNGDAIRRGKDGLLQGVTTGENGKVSGIVRFKEFQAEKVSSFLTPAVLFNVASIVVGQQHLADIKGQMILLNRKLDEIKEFQQVQRRSIIIGAIRYLEQAVAALEDGEIPEVVQNGLDGREADLLSIQEHICHDLEKFKEKVINIKESNLKKIHDYQEELEVISKELLLCLRARYAISNALKTNPSLYKIQIKRILSVSEALKVFLNMISEIEDYMHQSISKSAPFLKKQTTINKEIFSSVYELKHCCNFLRNTAEGLLNQMETDKDNVAPAPVILTAKIVDGGLVGISSFQKENRTIP
ncbi:hypothetical protein, partial [Zymomonas mobilis]